MNRSSRTPSQPEEIDASVGDHDPWSEFLSEDPDAPFEEVTSVRQTAVETLPPRAVSAAAAPAVGAPNIDPFIAGHHEPLDAPPRLDRAIVSDAGLDAVPSWALHPAVVRLDTPPPITESQPVAAVSPTSVTPVHAYRLVARARATAADPDRRISVADVLARQVPVHWSEAVAIVEELCGVLATAGSESLIPGTTEVRIGPDGAVHVDAPLGSDRDTRSLGRILNDLLSTTTTPLPLRLFVTSSTSSERFETIELFADALSHYGLPDRADLIQSLYRRCMDTPVGHQASTIDELPTLVESAMRTRRGRRTAVIAVAAAAALGVGLASGWLWLFSGSPHTPAAARAAVVPGPADVIEAERPDVTVAARDNWRLGSVAVPARPMERDAIVPVTRERPAARELPAPPARPAASLSAPSPAAPPLPLPPAPARVAAPPIATPAPRQTAGLPDPRIYSREHPDVQPPVLLPESQMPTLPHTPGEADSRAANVLEIIVDGSGGVQSVKFLNRPPRMADMMLLHGAKMLKFRPALKNGRPVNYLVRMNVARAPS